MKVFFTGATGVIGRASIPTLLAAGHDVRAVVRRQVDHEWLNDLGARPVAVDLFDPAAIVAATAGVDAIVHMATAIPPQAKMTKRISWEINDRLRSQATAHLADAALRNSVATFVQQSVSFVYADGGDNWLDESAPIDTVWDVLDSALDAERLVTRFAEEGGRGVVLRFSTLYGPGRTSSEYVSTVAARKLPIVGRGDNYVSHIHVADAASAIGTALTAPGGVYNVTDDTPVTKRQELEALASVVGAKAPRRIPRWLANTVVGPAATMLTVSHRVANRHLKNATGWAPEFPCVLDGWADVVADSSVLG